MRKLLLVAFAAAAMVVAAALPSASVARPATALVKCPPGSHDTQYCEHPCPDTLMDLENTANAAVTAALASAQGITDSSTAIHFDFLAAACSTFDFKLEFAVPGHEKKLIYYTIGVLASTTKAGASHGDTVTLTALGRGILARYAATHDRLTVVVIATSSSHINTTTKQLIGHITF
jgi:hypothetical protein